MPLYLLDTNAVSDFMRGNPRMGARVGAAADPVFTSVIVRGEILQGIERLPPGSRRRQLESDAGAAFAMLSCEQVTLQDADVYAVTKTRVQSLGFTLGENDLWIAASTLARGAVLVSRDVDFHRIPGLTVEDWTT